MLKACRVRKKTRNNISKRTDAQNRRLERFSRRIDNLKQPLVPKLFSLFQGKQEQFTLEDTMKLILLYNAGKSIYNEVLNITYSTDVILESTISEYYASAANAARIDVQEDFPGVFSDSTSLPQELISQRVGKLKGYIKEQEVENINTILSGAASGRYDTETTHKLMQYSVGLTQNQQKGMLNYYNARLRSILETEPNISQTEAERKAASYAEAYSSRALSTRVDGIADFELTLIYNEVYDTYIKEAQKIGRLGTVVKKWITKKDNHVCEICAYLDGQTVGLYEDFKAPLEFYGTQSGLPPIHPRCRCTIEYQEIKKPEESL